MEHPQCKQEQTLGNLDTRLDARRQKRTQAMMDSLECWKQTKKQQDELKGCKQ